MSQLLGAKLPYGMMLFDSTSFALLPTEAMLPLAIPCRCGARPGGAQGASCRGWKWGTLLAFQCKLLGKKVGVCSCASPVGSLPPNPTWRSPAALYDKTACLGAAPQDHPDKHLGSLCLSCPGAASQDHPDKQLGTYWHRGSAGLRPEVRLMDTLCGAGCSVYWSRLQLSPAQQQPLF